MDRFLEERVHFKESFRRFYSGFGIPKIDDAMREQISASIQVSVGAGLASYTNGRGTYGILPFMLSAVSAGGLYNFFRNMHKNTQLSSFFRRIRLFSPWELAIGEFTYSTGIYAFSEALKRDDKIWILCLVLAASGYYYATTSISTSDRVMSRRPLLKSFQVILPTALVAGAATYLFYFQQHEEIWLKCLPFLITAATGVENAHNACCKDATGNDRILLLKVIEMFIGGYCASISFSCLAVYIALNGFSWPCTALMCVGSLYGAFMIWGSLLLLETYLCVDSRVLYSLLGMVVGTLTFSSAILLVECLEEFLARNFAFGFFTLAGQSLFWFNFNQLRNRLSYLMSLPVPYSPFKRSRLQALGSYLAVYNSVVSVYPALRFGWKFSLLPMSCVVVGIYGTHRGVQMIEQDPSE